MTNTVYLHIGMNKTGSSAIQHYLSSNRQKLVAKGLLYPQVGCLNNAHYELSTLLGFANSKPAPVDVDSTFMRAFKKSLKDEVIKSPMMELVFSSEYFVLMRPLVAVKAFFEDYNVKVIVYLRRHDKWWVSAYNQAVRTVASPPWGRTFKAYLKYSKNKNPSIGNYRLLLDRWAEAFGKENLIVRPYERQQNEPGLVYDFMRAIDKERIVQEVAPVDVRINNSIGMSTLAFVDACQRARIDPEIRASLIRYALDNQDPVNDALSIDPGLLADLAVRHQDDYDYIAREYLGREDGQLFYEKLPDASAERNKCKPPSIDAVIESVVAVVRSAASTDSPMRFFK